MQHAIGVLNVEDDHEKRRGRKMRRQKMSSANAWNVDDDHERKTTTLVGAVSYARCFIRNAAKCGFAGGWLDLKRHPNQAKVHKVMYTWPAQSVAAIRRLYSSGFPCENVLSSVAVGDPVRDMCPSRRPMRLGARHRQVPAHLV